MPRSEPFQPRHAVYKLKRISVVTCPEDDDYGSDESLSERLAVKVYDCAGTSSQKEQCFPKKGTHQKKCHTVAAPLISEVPAIFEKRLPPLVPEKTSRPKNLNRTASRLLISALYFRRVLPDLGSDRRSSPVRLLVTKTPSR